MFFFCVYTFSNEADILIRIFLAPYLYFSTFSELERARQGGLWRCCFREVKKKDKKNFFKDIMLIITIKENGVRLLRTMNTSMKHFDIMK